MVPRLTPKSVKWWRVISKRKLKANVELCDKLKNTPLLADVAVECAYLWKRCPCFLPPMFCAVPQVGSWTREVGVLELSASPSGILSSSHKMRNDASIKWQHCCKAKQTRGLNGGTHVGVYFSSSISAYTCAKFFPMQSRGGCVNGANRFVCGL